MDTQVQQHPSPNPLSSMLDVATPNEASTISPEPLTSNNIQLATPVLKVIETAVISLEDDEISSSTDTAVSPLFKSNSAKALSDGSFTEDDKETIDVIKTGILQGSSDLDQTVSISNDEQDKVAEPVRTLTTKNSLWNLLRGASNAMTATQLVPEEANSTSNLPKAVEDSAVLQPIEKAAPTLTKRRSFAPFTTLQWSKSSRRHTLTAMEVNSSSVNVDKTGVQRSLDGTVPLPSQNVDEAKVAEDAMRFADARHVIKTEQDIEVIRKLADRLEQGWKEKQFELILMRSKMQESQLFFHDIQDENKHLRSQLASMSEQIVARDHDFEELQKIGVEQSKKEREIWEAEKVQAVEAVESQVKELQAQLRRFKNHDFVEESDDDEADFRDAVLFSANTSATSSVDGELQIQQFQSFGSLVSPTTPTFHGASTWQQNFVKDGHQREEGIDI